MENLVLRSNNIESSSSQFQFLDQYESDLYNDIEVEDEENDPSENYSIQNHSEKPSIENDLERVENERIQEVTDIPLQFGFMHSESDFINAIIDNDFTSSEEDDISRYYRNEENPILEDIFIRNDIKFEECTICLVKLDENDQIKQTICKHIFHGKCIQKWFETSVKCPLCRSKC